MNIPKLVMRSTYILLLRGINVGGKHILPMKELVRDLQSLRLENIRTYIQSGNIVFQSSEKVSPTLSGDIAATIEKRHGFRPRVFLMRAGKLKQAIESNPFPEAETKTLHLFFLASVPEEPDLDSLAKAKSPAEEFHLTNDLFYLYAPDGVGRSRLATGAEKFLGVPVTARNWRTVSKLWDMARAGRRRGGRR